MGRKKYYCDFCNRHFNDDKSTRFKHLTSVGHLNLKKEHYKMFRDPETILQEESVKKPCRKFQFEGFCPFGGSCTYSHYSKEDLDVIRQEVISKKQRDANKPTVDDWLNKYYSDLEREKEKSNDLLWSSKLPPEFLINYAYLPPSLLPYSIKDFINTDLESWG